MNKAITALLLSLGFAVTVNTHADPKAGMYRWYDADGTVQYSDRPPQGVEAELVTTYGAVKPKGSEPGAATEKGTEEEAKKEGEEELASEMEVLPEKDPTLCKQARANLKALDGARIRITEPDGSKRLLNENEREAQKANARKVIDMHC